MSHHQAPSTRYNTPTQSTNTNYTSESNQTYNAHQEDEYYNQGPGNDSSRADLEYIIQCDQPDYNNIPDDMKDYVIAAQLYISMLLKQERLLQNRLELAQEAAKFDEKKKTQKKKGGKL